MPRPTPAFFSFVSLTLAAAPALADEAPPDTSHARASPPIHVLVDDLVGLRTEPTAVGGQPFSQSGVVAYSSGRLGGMQTTRWTVSPSLDALLGEHVTFGGSVAVTRSVQRIDGAVSSAPTNEAWSVAVVPRIGYLAKLNDALYVWPRFGMGFATGDSSTQPVAGVGGLGASSTSGVGGLGPIAQSSSYDAWIARAELLLSARVVDYMLVSLGPEASLTVSHTTISYGVEMSSTNLRLGGRLALGLVF
jgi:hypothetical protein